MDENQLSELYRIISEKDSTYQSRLPYEQFVEKMKDSAYVDKITQWAGIDASTLKKKESSEIQSGTTVSPSADSSLVSPSQDPKVPIFKGFSEEQKSNLKASATEQTYMGGTDRKTPLKIRGVAIIPKSEEDFNIAIEGVNEKLVDQEEEYVVPDLQNRFGMYGFKFEKSGALSDNVKVTSPTNETIEIPLDNWTDKGDAESSKELKDFMLKHKGKIDKVSTNFNDYEKRILSDKEATQTFARLNDEANNLNKSQNQAFQMKADIDRDREALSSMAQGTPEYKALYEKITSDDKNFELFATDIAEKEKMLSSAKQKLNRSVGRYSLVKEKQGDFSGALINKFLEGYGGIGAGIANYVIDAAGEFMPIKQLITPTGYREEFEKAVKKTGADVPKDMTDAQFNEWESSLTGEYRDGIDAEIRDQIKKGVKKEKVPEIRESVLNLLGDKGTTKEYTSRVEQSGIVNQGVLGLAGSLPAMLMPGGPAARVVSFFAMGTDAVMKEMEGNPEFDNISENEKLLISTPIGIANAVLEEFGFRNALGSSGVVNNLIMKAIGKSSRTTTAKTFSELIKNEVEDGLSRGLLTVTAGALAEGETGAAQQVAEYAVKDIYNAVKEKQMFNTPSTVKEYITDVVEAGLAEAVGGFVMTVPGAVANGYNKNNYNGVSDETVKAFGQIANDSKIMDAYVVDLKNRITSGEITPEQAKEEMDGFRKSIALYNAIPEGVADKRKSLSLLSERSSIQAKIQNKDEALTKPQRERIAEINTELENLSREVVLPEQVAEEVKPKEKKVLPEGYTLSEAIDEDGEVDYEAEDELRKIAKERGLGITSDREVSKVVRDENGNIVGGAFTSTDSEGNYTFDVVVSEQAEGKGIGSIILDQVASMPQELTEAFPDAKMKVDVVNPTMRAMLEDRGFEVTEQIGMDRVIMEKKSEEVVSSRTQGGGVSVSNKASLDGLMQNTTDEMKRSIITSATKAVNTLKSVLPNFDIVIHDNEDDYNTNMATVNGRENSAGNFSFSRNEKGELSGRIDINLNKANARTVAHEVAHGVMLKAFNESQEVFKDFRSKISKVLSEDTNARLNNFASQYSESESHEEFLVELTSALTENNQTLSKVSVSKIAQIINELVSKLTNGAIVPFKDTQDMTDINEVIDFLNNVSGAIGKGDYLNISEDGNGSIIAGGVVDINKIKSKSSLYKKVDISWTVPNSFGLSLIVPTQSRELSSVVTESGGAIVITNSDATGIGVTKDGDIIQGGIGYTFIDKNVNDGIGFAASNDGKITAIFKAAKAAANIRDKENPNMKGMPVAVFVMIQSQAAMFGNTYSAEYFGRVLMNLAKTLKLNTEEEKKQLIEFIDDYVSNNKKGQKYKASFEKLKSLINNTDFLKKDSIKKLVDLMVTNREEKDVVSSKFGFDVRRSFFEKFFIAINPPKIGQPARELRIALADMGYNHQEFFEEFSDENVKRVLEGRTAKDKMSDGGFALTGFFIDPYQSESDYVSKSKSGSFKHKQFNSKFSGERPFILDRKVYVNDAFPEARFWSEKKNSFVPVTVSAAGSLYPRTKTSSSEIIKRAKEYELVGQTKTKSKSQVGDTSKDENKIINLQNGTDKKQNKGNGTLEKNKEQVRYNGTDAIGQRSRTESDKAASRQKAKEKISSLQNNASREAANDYNKSIGLPEIKTHEFQSSNKDTQTKIGEIYQQLKDVTFSTYKETELERKIFDSYKSEYLELFKKYNIKSYKDLVEKSYAEFAKEANAQFEALNIKIEFHEGESNYQSSAEMLDDVHNFGHLWVFKGGEDHTLLGSKTADKDGITANDKFRAVHDYFGHSVEGYQFGKNGEENAWIEHSKMFSPLAQIALSSESRGQNSFVNYSGVNDVALEKMKVAEQLTKKGLDENNPEMIAAGKVLLNEANNEFQFAEQKSVVLPRKYTDAKKYFVKQLLTTKTTTNEKANEDGEQKRRKDGEEDVTESVQSEGENGRKKINLQEKQVLGTGGAVEAAPTEEKGKYKVTIAFKSKFGGLSYKSYEFNNKAHFQNWLKKNGSKFDISEIYEPTSKSQVDDAAYKQSQEINNRIATEHPEASVLIQPKGEDLSLTAIYVKPEQREKGIGSKVLESIKREAEKAGKKIVLDATNELDSKTDLVRLGKFYEKNGFKSVGDNKFEYNTRAKTTSKSQIVVNETTNPGYDNMMGKVDGIIEKSMDRRSTYEQVMDAVMGYMQTSLVYEKATDQEREQMVRDVREAFGLKQKSAPSVGRILGTIKDINSITATEKSLLKKQIQDYARGAREAKDAWRQANRDLTSAVNELKKKGKITTSQLITVLRKFVSVNMFNPESIEKFVDYMEKVFNDAEYAEKISKLRKLAKRGKKNIKTKIGISSALFPLLNKMLSIDASLIPDSVMETFVEMVEMVGTVDKVLALKDRLEVTRKVSEVLDAVEEEHSIVDGLKDSFDNFPNKVFDANGVLDYAGTIEAMATAIPPSIVSTISSEDAKLMKKWKSRIVPKADAVKKTQAELDAERNQLLLAVSVESIDASLLPTAEERKAATRISDSLKEEEYESLTSEQLTTLLKVISNINNGYLPHQAQLLIEAMEKGKSSNVLESSIKRAKILPVSGFVARMKAMIKKDANAIEMMIRRAPLFYVDQLFGDFNSRDIFNSVFKGLSSGITNYQSEMKIIEAKIEKAIADVANSLGKSPNAVMVSSYKMMTYMLQLEHDSNPDSKQVNQAKDFIEATIKHIRKTTANLSTNPNSPTGDKTADALQQIMNDYSDTNGQIDALRLYNSFNFAEKAAIKVIQEINAGTRDKAIYTSHIIRGDKLNPIDNYVHHHVLPISNNQQNISGVTTATQFNNMTQPSTRGRSLIARTGTVNALDFNVFNATQRGANYVMLDYYMTEPIRIARKTMIETEKLLEESDASNSEMNIFNGIKNSLELAIDNTLTTQFHNNSFADEVVKFLTKNGYRTTLASTTRFVGELSSNMGFIMINNRKEWLLGVNEYRDFVLSGQAIDVMINLGSTATTRVVSNDQLSGRLVDSSVMSATSGTRRSTMKGDAHNALLTIYNKTLKPYKNFVELVADNLISTPDKIMMRPLWFGMFATKFKEMTGQNPDMDKIASNDEAYMTEFRSELAASRDSADEGSVVVGASNNPFMGILKGANTSTETNSAVKMFNIFNNYMTTFLQYEYAAARTGIHAAMGDGMITRKQGVALMAAVTTRMTLYTLLTGMLSNGLLSLFGADDDDEDEKSLMQKLGQALASSAAGILLGRDFGNAMRGVINYGVEAVNEEMLTGLRNDEYDPYTDAISYSPLITSKDDKGQSDMKKLFINMLGPLSPVAKTTDLLIKSITSAPKKEEDAIQRASDEMTIRLPLEVLGNLGLVPVYKDVRKVVLKSIYQSLENPTKVKTDEEKRFDENPRGMTRSDLKRYYPDEYEKYYGEGSKIYEDEKFDKEIEKIKSDLERKIKDEKYNYIKPKKEKKNTRSYREDVEASSDTERSTKKKKRMRDY